MIRVGRTTPAIQGSKYTSISCNPRKGQTWTRSSSWAFFTALVGANFVGPGFGFAGVGVAFTSAIVRAPRLLSNAPTLTLPQIGGGGRGRIPHFAYSGPEIPPSFRMRQKWTIMNRLARIGRKI